MSDPNSNNTAGASFAAPNPIDNPCTIILGRTPGVLLLNHDQLRVIMRAPLPGIVIFVHGVNSDGEWYKETEEGLCAGLNERLKRCDEHMAHPTPEGGQLTPATYMSELTPKGYINPNMTHKTFLKDEDHFSPAIHFRWGYKADLVELQKYGDGIYLNEENYWGGGPFANGCTTLPDMWGQGLSENLFLWMHIQHLNPVNDRNVFACPPKPYFVLAALRLARLVQSIRKKQADVPITIVCHSQGNMIGMAAAFFGDAWAPARDPAGKEGRCVADSYVLCNAPYSLASSNFTEDWSQSDMKDKQGGRGRQTSAARIGTLRAFFDIIRQPAAKRQSAEDIDQAMANVKHGFDAATDCKAYGNGASTCGKVTLYCNPHDQVISSLSVQGIGWRGMHKDEIRDTNGTGVFSQRVFAQGHPVGAQGTYHYWKNHYNKPAAGSQGFWVPESPKLEYSVSKGLDASRGKPLAWIFTLAMAPFTIVAVKLSSMRINALPDDNWEIPIDAPTLPTFSPQARRFGVTSEQFDQDYDAPGQWRHAGCVRDAGDVYSGDRPILQKKGEKRDATDAAKGDADSEAALRYEDHARLRMQARREGMVKKSAEHVDAEDDPTKASAEYKAWQEEKIKTYLADNINTHATDHSTIMTNGMHAQKALAYDVAIGLCHIRDEDLHTFRIAADWRFGKGLDRDDPNRKFEKYFLTGYFTGLPLGEWTRAKNSEGRMPDKIVDQREHRPLSPRMQERINRGGHP